MPELIVFCDSKHLFCSIYESLIMALNQGFPAPMIFPEVVLDEGIKPSTNLPV
jgi:hypothetical protein